ncbi:hypothetical protein BD311DRAFT_749016 [Dichomitus squalens]|uniref:Uncharacterized protein n=1 Tax=Dichomitus squalens TaxID=114155 RepID=A0A4Q9MZU2_9APHY|nr:hypothetical protein BD311DRAFT_749016 [Dichomitus squalens]
MAEGSSNPSSILTNFVTFALLSLTRCRFSDVDCPVQRFPTDLAECFDTGIRSGCEQTLPDESYPPLQIASRLADFNHIIIHPCSPEPADVSWVRCSTRDEMCDWFVDVARRVEETRGVRTIV